MKFFRTILLTLAVLCLLVPAMPVPASVLTSTPTRIRSVGTLPSACTAGTSTVAADMVVVSNVLYLCTATNTWTALVFVGGNIGAATGTSLVLTGIKDGTIPVTVGTGATCTLGSTYSSGYYFNQEATAGTAVTCTLPVAAQGKQYCMVNSYNGSAADTGVLELATSGTGQFIIFTDGTLSATGGNVQSPGAAGDAGCVVGVDSTHWQFFQMSGSTAWTKH